MIRKSTAVAARQNLGDLLNQVHYGRDSILITRNGKSVAALVDVDLFERIRRVREDFKQLTDAIGQSYAGVNPATAESEIGQAVVWARRSAGPTRGARKRR
jgi:prevent-host-death family protein